MGKANVICAVGGAASFGGRRRHGWHRARPRRRRSGRLTFVATVVALSLGMLAQPAAGAAAQAPATCPNAALRTGPSMQLPDCRAFEQVSPASKNGSAAVLGGNPAQAAPGGDGLAYVSGGAFSGGPSASLPDAYVSRRDAGGWETVNVSPPTPDPTPPGGDPITYDFSPDLSQLVVELPLQQLAEGATPEVSNLFLANAGGYSWINSVKPHLLLPEGCPIPQLLSLCWQVVDQVAFAGASPDFRHVLFESTESLVAGVPEERENLYESTYEAGKWHVSSVGILPDGAASEGSTAGGGSSVFYATIETQADRRVAHAISEDGARVVFGAPADGGAPDPAQAGLLEVYDRIDGSETIELSAPAPGAEPQLTTPEPATFWAASADGNRVFFTSAAELTTSSYTGVEPKGQDLYEYNLATKALKDLTVDANLPADEEEGAAVQGVVGASSDGSYVYFVAKGQLVPGKGVDHADNLYMVHEGGTPVYIATLNQSDEPDWTEIASLLASYVTPDGRHVAFTSTASLPTANFPGGYDNVNTATAAAEPEVYEYAAPAAAEEEHGLSGELFCASCDPSGAPPIGPGVLGGISRGERESQGISQNTPFQQARAVSDNGARVFFSSRDPLAGGGANGKAKVFEYEQAGEGSCETSSGCVYLLSSPTSPEEEFFIGADSEGNNVFFATVSQLTASDQDKLRDVYDARVDGGLASPPVEAPCRGGCREASAEGSLPAPLSGFAGTSGNLAPPGKAKPARTRARKLAAALRSCRKKRGKRRRSCESQARKRYGKAPKGRMSVHGSKRRER